MNDSMAQPGRAIPTSLPGWKTAISWIAACAIALLFLASGLWKITDAPGAAVRMAQAKVPQNLSLAAALFFGITETFAGVMILVPRFRRWGAWLASLLLIAFLIYVGIQYNALRGADCSCFPWIKRAVGPAFFIGDGIMLALAVIAGWWSQRSFGVRSAAIIMGAVTVFAMVSYGVEVSRQSGAKAPDSITVNGQPFSLQQGKILIYFFDPQCLHCFRAAQAMSKMNWGDTKVIGMPSQQPQSAEDFMTRSELRAPVSFEYDRLKKLFPFESPPAAVAIENGREKKRLTMFEGEEPGATLKRIGFIY